MAIVVINFPSEHELMSMAGLDQASAHHII